MTTLTSHSELVRVHDLYTQTKYKNLIRAKSRKIEGPLTDKSCEVCSAVDSLEIHHDSYEDSATDYRILCKPCHDGFHRFAKSPMIHKTASKLAALDNAHLVRAEAEAAKHREARIERKLDAARKRAFRSVYAVARDRLKAHAKRLYEARDEVYSRTFQIFAALPVGAEKDKAADIWRLAEKHAEELPEPTFSRTHSTPRDWEVGYPLGCWRLFTTTQLPTVAAMLAASTSY